MHSRSRKWFPNNKYTTSSTTQGPMGDERAIYRPPKGRLYHGYSNNSWNRMDGSARKQSNYVTPSNVSYYRSSPKPDFAEMSSRLGNLELVNGDSSSRLFCSNSKMETHFSQAKGVRLSNSTTASSCPMDDKKAIYKPPKGRLFGAGIGNTRMTMHGSTRNQSDPVMVSSRLNSPSAPTTDLVELSPCLGNQGFVRSPSSKGKFHKESTKYQIEDRHSSWRSTEQSVNMVGKNCKIDESFTTTKSGNKQGQASQNTMDSSEELDGSQILFDNVPYSICYAKNPNLIKLKTSLLLENREKRKEMNLGIECRNIKILRPGMVHLRHYLPIDDQVKIIEACCKLGIGPGGFYQPSYHDGGKLNLKMMFLGKNWDPQANEYSIGRSTDGAKPPSIPEEFLKLVERTIQESHFYLKGNADEMLPSMTPDICIVNFYTEIGRLGLHQDKDESRESLLRGLPVVSFSIGDSAVFVYGDQRDVDKAEKVVLESGDVLIFGGSSRHIFHGVTGIISKSAPKFLLEESNLRPGRLNLTFRQY